MRISDWSSDVCSSDLQKTFYIYNVCDHEDAYAETGTQAVSYTTGVPAMTGAAMILTGAWEGKGVCNIEQFDPDPFMDMLNKQGMPWQVEEMPPPLDFSFATDIVTGEYASGRFAR